MRVQPRDIDSNVTNYGDGNATHPLNRRPDAYFVSGSLAATNLYAGRVTVRSFDILIAGKAANCVVELYDSADGTTTNKRKISLGGSMQDPSLAGGIMGCGHVDLDIEFEEGLTIVVANGGTVGAAAALSALIKYDKGAKLG